MKPIFHHPNALKIYGPPGAGKTRELVRILQDHVADGDFLLAEAVIVSFTRAAAHDIARRVNPDGEPGRYHCTLHALCKRYYGFDREIVTDAKLREFFKGEGIDYKGGAASGDPEEWAPSADWSPSDGGQLMGFFSRCRNQLISIEEGRRMYEPPRGLEAWWDAGRMEAVWGHYEAWKRETGLIDFTDMLEAALLSPPQTYFPCFVLDEAQDCTPLQWQVAQAFAACAERAYVAGDDDQAIYSWAGASPGEFLAAKTPYEDVLHINHRSGGVLVDLAQTFIRRNKQRTDKGMVAKSEGGTVAREISLPNLNPDESTFIMARAHYLLAPAMEELTALSFPFVDKRGSYGVSGKAAVNYGRFRRLSMGQALTLEEWRLLLDLIPSAGEWLMRGAKKRVKDITPELQRSTYVRARDLFDYGATETLVNAIKSGSLDPLARVEKARREYFAGVAERYGEEYLDERKAAAICSVGPIHAFKGLEADHAIIHEGMPPAAYAEATQDPEPERRVFYVGMTRARNRVTWLSGRAFGNYKEVL